MKYKITVDMREYITIASQTEFYGTMPIRKDYEVGEKPYMGKGPYTFNHIRDGKIVNTWIQDSPDTPIDYREKNFLYKDFPKDTDDGIQNIEGLDK